MTWTAATADALNQTFSTVFWNWTRPGVYYFNVGYTITPATGSTWTNNGVTFTLLQFEQTGDGAATVYMSGSGDPELVVLPGTLTKATGTGDATMAYISAGDVDEVELTISPGIVYFTLAGTKGAFHLSLDGSNWMSQNIEPLWPHPSVYAPNESLAFQGISFEPGGTDQTIYIKSDDDGTVEGAFYFNSKFHPTHAITTTYKVLPGS